MVLTNVSTLVDADRGLISPRHLQQRVHLPGGAAADIRPLLALPMPRDPDSQPRRLLYHLHGRGPGAGHSRPAGQVNAFLNICRHRGNRLCRADDGNASTFICAYHGWAYNADGKLAAVPNLQDAYYNELDQSEWGLIPVAQLDSYKGLIFATFDPEAPPLLEYLGPMAWYLDTLFDRREGGAEVLRGVHKWVVPCNWKLPLRTSLATPTTCSGPTSPPSAPDSASPPAPPPAAALSPPATATA